jgi:hypothetical protein
MRRVAETGNAADPEQVRSARRRQLRREKRFLDAVREVMATPAGRLMFGERDLGLLAQCGIYNSAMHPSGSTVYYNIGRQDIGKEITGFLIAASEETYQTMEREMRALAVRDDNETQAGNAVKEAES